jgi:hypothetical protein
MDEQNSGFILCDISFNGQLVADVKLPKACSMSNIVQGLWLDDNFRKTGLEYLKTKDEKTAPNEAGETSTPVKSFGGIDRCILRAYGMYIVGVSYNIYLLRLMFVCIFDTYFLLCIYLLMNDEHSSGIGCMTWITSMNSVSSLAVAIRIMPAWKWLEFRDFIVDFENKKDCYTVGDILGTLCTGLHKPVLRIVPKSE